PGLPALIFRPVGINNVVFFYRGFFIARKKHSVKYLLSLLMVTGLSIDWVIIKIVGGMETTSNIPQQIVKRHDDQKDQIP
ncbi:hypothetical protein ACJX0J_040238, partial [Zea mays]